MSSVYGSGEGKMSFINQNLALCRATKLPASKAVVTNRPLTWSVLTAECLENVIFFNLISCEGKQFAIYLVQFRTMHDNGPKPRLTHTICPLIQISKQLLLSNVAIF